MPNKVTITVHLPTHDKLELNVDRQARADEARSLSSLFSILFNMCYLLCIRWPRSFAIRWVSPMSRNMAYVIEITVRLASPLSPVLLI